MTNVFKRRLSRRAALSGATRVGFAAAGAGGMVSLFGCSGPAEVSVRLGINSGTQPLWRYVAARSDQLLKPNGVNATFLAYPSEQEAVQALNDNKIDVYATITSLVPQFAATGGDLVLFLPLAWIAETLPVIALTSSPVRSISELAGKRMAIPDMADPGFAFWRALIAANYGFRFEDRISGVSGSSDVAGALRNGDVEAGVVNSLLWAALKPSGQFKIVSDLNSEWKKLSPNSKPLVFGGYLARKPWVNANGRAIDELAKAHQEALRQYRSSKDTFLKIAAEYTGGTTGAMSVADAAVIGSYLGLDIVEPERAFLSDGDVADANRIWEQMNRAGILRERPKPAGDLIYLSNNRPK